MSEVSPALNAHTRELGEQWLLRKLLKHGVDALAGVTAAGGRKDRFRAAIRDNGLEAVLAGAENRKPINYAQVFERLYGEKL